jgi:predicted polyphosphate/ATP-dependent NAD kinase
LKKLGFIINPIAGMGGSVGLKGTDGMVEEAVRRGAKPVAAERARNFVSHIKKKFEIYTCSAPMGENVLTDCNMKSFIVYKPCSPTTAHDTKNAVANMKNVDLILFVGGDGTARDVMEVADAHIPVLGIPSGVKMYSAVFAQTPHHAADILNEFADGLPLEEREVVDIDEDAFRKGKLAISVKGYCLTPVHERVQSSKGFFSRGMESKKLIAEHVAEKMDGGTTYIIGGGSTTWELKKAIGIDGSMLGVDVVRGKKLLCGDAAEANIKKFMGKKNKIIVSPLGGYGFIFGRGNEQISPEIIRKVGKENMIVISTPGKLATLHSLKVDTGDDELDKSLGGYARVITGYGESKLMRVE